MFSAPLKRTRLGLLLLAAAAAAFALAPTAAVARDAYVALSGDDAVAVLDLSGASPTVTVPVGDQPDGVAITPDGKYAYVSDEGDDAVSVISTADRAVVATVLLPVGSEPHGVAITPDGSEAWVADSGKDKVTVIDTATKAVSGPPISVGDQPDGVAISPDGGKAWVADSGSDEVTVIDTATKAVSGLPIPVGATPSQIAVGPRGGRAFVTNSGASSVTPFNPDNGSPGLLIPVGAAPSGIAIDPSGTLAYAMGQGDGTLTPIAIGTNAPGAPVSGFDAPAGVAVAPSGSRGFVANSGGDSVTGFDTASNSLSSPVPVGATPSGIAIVPDQGPIAGLFVSPARPIANGLVGIDGGPSHDSDSKISNYNFAFGDGTSAKGPAVLRHHRYKRPGTYLIKVTVADDEGCSTTSSFTGQTVSCNGSAAAATTAKVVVADDHGPVLRVDASRRRRLGKRVELLARCPAEPCRVRAVGSVRTRTKGRGFSWSADYRLSSTRVVSLSTGVWGRLKLRLPLATRRAAFRALRSGGTAKVRLDVIGIDQTDLKTVRRRGIALFGPKPIPRKPIRHHG